MLRGYLIKQEKEKFKQLEGMTRMVGIGDTITVKNVHGEIIWRNQKIYANSVLVLSQTTPQLVCRKKFIRWVIR